MLNPFPIQFLALFAYFILRVFVGMILIVSGARHIRNRAELKGAFHFRLFPYPSFFVWYLAALELVLGVMFVAGFYTQIAALITLFIALKLIVLRNRLKTGLIESRMFYVLLFACSLSLLITGAGVLGFDLPV